MSRPYGFGLLRASVAESDLTHIDGGLDTEVEIVEGTPS